MRQNWKNKQNLMCRLESQFVLPKMICLTNHTKLDKKMCRLEFEFVLLIRQNWRTKMCRFESQFVLPKRICLTDQTKLK